MEGRGGRATPLLVDVIVVAAGSSARMGGIDKLAWSVAGRPLLAHTLASLAAAPVVERIVLVTAPERVERLRAATWLPDRVVGVVAGGATRSASVVAGLHAVAALGTSDDRIVLVHDGARPVVHPPLVEAVARAAQRHGAAIPAVPIAETVKRVSGELVEATLDRSSLRAAQTPQGARLRLFLDALAHPAAGTGDWTDEAALLEACRIPVHVIPGEPSNLKVTVPADLERVAALVGADRTERRHGIGQDTHPFGPGTPLRLGGISFEGVPRLAGHSDGDVALHAVADALLGAAGLGDLGRWFPAGPRTPQGVASEALLRAIVGRVAEAGWQPAGIDLTIVGSRPRLGDRLEAMREAIARLVGLEAAAVNVKASTGNLDGSEGAGRTISAVALATLAPLESTS